MLQMENAHALVIGIAAYQHIRPLPPTVSKDAQNIYDILTSPLHCGYERQNVARLFDEEATKEAIMDALVSLAERSNADSTVVVYISAHGGRVPFGEHAGEYLLPVDTLSASGEEMIASAIRGEELTAALQAVRARKMIVLFDCCHAAGLAQPKDASDEGGEGALSGMKAGLSENYYAALQAGTGRAVIASSRDTESSWVMPSDENSLFTKHLLGGLRGGVASKDGLVRIFDLFEYIQPRITGEKSVQHPVFKADLESNLPVALYLGGQKGDVPEVEPGFRYDVYINYTDKDADAEWVWNRLVPRMEQAGLRVAVSEDAEDPGVARVVGIERAIKQSRRTILVLSRNYLVSHVTDFRATLAMSIGIEAGTYRVVPIKIEQLDDGELPDWVRALVSVNLAHPTRAEQQFDRLLRSLAAPLPEM